MSTVRNPTVLRKETIKKFGYDPNKLSLCSPLRVVLKCPGCKGTRIRRLTRSGTICNKCATTARNQKLRQPGQKSFTLSEIVNFFYRGNIQNVGWKLSQPQLRVGRTIVNSNSRESLMRQLGVPEKTKKLELAEFKKYLKRYILNQNGRELELMTLILAKHITLYVRIQASGLPRAFVCDSRGLLRHLFDRTGIKYAGSKNGNLRVKYGSFFVNGSWIHIG